MRLEYKIDYIRAYKAVKKLLRENVANTIFIFELIRALNPPSLRWCYRKLLETESGAEVAYNSEEVSEYFSTLSERPEGSVGKECHKIFPDQEYLLKVSRRLNRRDNWIDTKHPHIWIVRRNRDTHDTWHTLTGYPPTLLGEMCLAAFTFAQTRGLGWLMICLLIMIKHGIYKPEIISMVRRAYLRGKNAKFLLAENYNDLFSEDLESARKRLNILP
jgi:ubiquinone biosynthesis protein COQ4